MNITSIIAIYALFWVLGAMLSLPFGVRTHEEAGVDKIPGQADSAPAEFSFGRLAKRATVVSLGLFALFYANYVNGWITVDDINLMPAPPQVDGKPA